MVYQLEQSKAGVLPMLLNGFRFLRVDLDARAAKSGHSYLFHLTMDNHGRPIQLKYRFWDASRTVEGILPLENNAVIATRIVAEQRQETVVDVQPGYAFSLPHQQLGWDY